MVDQMDDDDVILCRLPRTNVVIRERRTIGIGSGQIEMTLSFERRTEPPAPPAVSYD